MKSFFQKPAFLKTAAVLLCLSFLGFFNTASAGYYDLAGYTGKVIRVNTFAQKLTYYESGVKVGEFRVSTGDATHETPNGRYKLVSKADRMYSKSARKYMPYWMEFSEGTYGIHAFPENFKGDSRTTSIVGVKAAGGCVRLTKEEAAKLYAWADLNTTIVIAADTREFASEKDEQVIREYYAALNEKKYAKALGLRIDEKYTLGEMEKANRGYSFELTSMKRTDGDLLVKFKMTNAGGRVTKGAAKFRIIQGKIIRSYRVSP